MQGIFLSYRREDAAPYARLLQFQLKDRLPHVQVFMDLDSIEPGLDFAEVIQNAVESCGVLITLIGRQWATIADEEGRRRLDDPDDYVRFEVKTALERGKRVVPVLVDGAKPLRQHELPADIAKLARLNAVELGYSRYEYDADRLISLIERVLAPSTPKRYAVNAPAVARLVDDLTATLHATLHTNHGSIRLVLYEDQAPATVRNFVKLAEGTTEYTDPRTGQKGSGPYYDGTIVHRVIAGFMIQMGDPTGTGRGGPGFKFDDEFHSSLRFDRPYRLAMANAGPNTNGSQFFITVTPTPHLNGKHTIFGQVADEASERVVDSIATTPTGSKDRPRTDVVLERVEIEQTP